MITSVRIVLTVLLLVIVWQHEHWATALCLTLSAVATELSVIRADRQQEVLNTVCIAMSSLLTATKKTAGEADTLLTSLRTRPEGE